MFPCERLLLSLQQSTLERLPSCFTSLVLKSRPGFVSQDLVQMWQLLLPYHKHQKATLT